MKRGTAGVPVAGGMGGAGSEAGAMGESVGESVAGALVVRMARWGVVVIAVARVASVTSMTGVASVTGTGVVVAGDLVADPRCVAVSRSPARRSSRRVG